MLGQLRGSGCSPPSRKPHRPKTVRWLAGGVAGLVGHHGPGQKYDMTDPESLATSRLMISLKASVAPGDRIGQQGPAAAMGHCVVERLVHH
jgi:hypothetical protein